MSFLDNIGLAYFYGKLKDKLVSKNNDTDTSITLDGGTSGKTSVNLYKNTDRTCFNVLSEAVEDYKYSQIRTWSPYDGSIDGARVLLLATNSPSGGWSESHIDITDREGQPVIDLYTANNDYEANLSMSSNESTNGISLKVNNDGVYTRFEVDKTGINFKTPSRTFNADTIVTSVNGTAPDTEGNVNVDLTGYYTKTETDAEIAKIVNSAPETLDTLNELAAALGDDPNFATTVSNQIGLKANSADLATVARSGKYSDLTGAPAPYTHPTSGVTAGTYNSVTVDANGHVTAASNVAAGVALKVW